MIIRELQNYITNVMHGVVRGETIRRIECPVCHKKEAYTWYDKPFRIICPRLNKCGEITKMRELVPYLFDIAKLYKPTKENPHYPAKVYLQSRGIPQRIIDSVNFEYVSSLKRGGIDLGPAIMFDLGGGVKNGRLFNPPEGEGKTHNIGKIGGKLWGDKYIKDWSKPIYLVEGIIDALSFMASGCQSMAYISSTYTPDFTPYRDKMRHVIVACDNDKAGVRAIQKIKFALEDAQMQIPCDVCLPPEGEDWNDLCQDELGDKQINDAMYRGRLHEVSSPQEYCDIYKEWMGKVPYVFELFNCTWMAKEKELKNEVRLTIDKIADFTIKLLKTILCRDDKGRESNIWNVQITRYDKVEKEMEVSAEELANLGRARVVFASLVSVSYDNNQAGHAALLKHLFEQRAMRIRRLRYHGVDPLTGAFVTKRFCVYKGNLQVVKNGMFRVGPEYIEPLDLLNSIQPKPCDYKKVFRTYIETFGYRGMAAFGWWVGSLFRDDMLQRYNFFPFLSLHGEAQTGKSTMALFLSRMRGHDYEGYPVSSDLTTAKAFMRNMSQFSGTSFNVLEGNEWGKMAIDIESFLSLYNGGNLFSRANNTNDNSTNQDAFHGTVQFVQNREQFKTSAMKQRVFSIPFTRKGLYKSKEAFMELQAIPADDICFLGATVMKHMDEIRDKYRSKFEYLLKWIFPMVQDNRLAEVHASVAAFYITVAEVMGLSSEEEIEDFKTAICQFALKKKDSLVAIDSSLLETFIDIVQEAVERDHFGVRCEDEGDARVYTVWLTGMMAFDSFKHSQLRIKEIREALKDSQIVISPSKVSNFGKISKRCVVFKVLKDDQD